MGLFLRGDDDFCYMLEVTMGKHSHTFRRMLLIDKTVLTYIDLLGKYVQIAHLLPSHLSTPVFFEPKRLCGMLEGICLDER